MANFSRGFRRHISKASVWQARKHPRLGQKLAQNEDPTGLSLFPQNVSNWEARAKLGQANHPITCNNSGKFCTSRPRGRSLSSQDTRYTPRRPLSRSIPPHKESDLRSLRHKPPRGGKGLCSLCRANPPRSHRCPLGKASGLRLGSSSRPRTAPLTGS